MGKPAKNRGAGFFTQRPALSLLPLTALLVGCMGASLTVQAQTVERELGDFDLKMATTPVRSMAQGLVQPDGTGTVHGGLDLTHDSGLYAGQWTPSVGSTPSSHLEVDSYAGFQHPLDNAISVEVGTIRYSYPDFSELDSHALYAGLTILGSHIGAAVSADPDKRSDTLFISFDRLPLGLGFSVKYTTHQLDTPATVPDGAVVGAFNDWSLSLSRPLLGIDLALSYSNSNLSGDQCSAYSGHNGDCEGMVVLKAVSALF